MFYAPPESLDCKIFSPLHSQMQAELGSSSMFYPVTSDCSIIGHNGVQFQYGTNETDDVSQFLSSVLINDFEENVPEDLGTVNTPPTDVKPSDGDAIEPKPVEPGGYVMVR